MTLSTPSPRRFPSFSIARLTATVAALSAMAALTLANAPQAHAHDFGAPQVRKAAAGSDSSSRTARDRHPGAIGYASYYARKFIGRLMADGTPMRADSDNAASLTLPLGTKALVTNLKNGRSVLVTIRDRGPYIRGRIIDLSPSTAKALGMLNAGVVKVAVVPLDALTPGQKREAIVAAAGGGAFEFEFGKDGG